MIKRFSGCLVVLVIVIVTGLAPGAPVAASGTGVVQRILLDSVPVSWTPETRQVITVNRTRGTHARITFWRREQGHWVRALRSTSARIGYGGLVPATEREQGTGTTPIGTFSLLFTFGTIARRPGWALPYRRIRPRDYWVEDNRSAFYNRYRNRNLGGFRWWLDTGNVNGSERLADYPREYRMSVITSFNYENPVHYRGAGIFLHVNGSGPTAGCVSAPRRFLAGVMARLDPEARPLIAIGR